MYWRWTEYCTAKMVPATFATVPASLRLMLRYLQYRYKKGGYLGRIRNRRPCGAPGAVIWACWVARPFLRYRAVKVQPTHYLTTMCSTGWCTERVVSRQVPLVKLILLLVFLHFRPPQCLAFGSSLCNGIISKSYLLLFVIPTCRLTTLDFPSSADKQPRSLPHPLFGFFI